MTNHSLHQRMAQTGIGLAGIDGVWWRAASEPFRLPAALGAELAACAEAIFTFFDVVTALYATPEGAACGLHALLTARVPPAIPRLMGPGPVLAVRPDFQLVPLDRPPHYRLVATELEICPSAQGVAHAMQHGYALPADLVAAMLRLLAGRELLVVGTGQWSEFLFDQLAFCRALVAAGGRARVLFDPPISAIAEQISAGLAWQPPMFGISARPAIWNSDLVARIAGHGFAPLLWPTEAGWPREVGDAVVFRFGYFACFSPALLHTMIAWQAAGATFLNPTMFVLDSKVLLAALQLPAVRAALAARSPETLAVLDSCLPETRLIVPELVPQLRSEREQWVLKYAGYDQSNQAWGGRGLRVGARCSPETWAAALDHCLAAAWPVVAQRNTPTAHIDIAIRNQNGTSEWMHGGATRLRSFFLREHAPQRISVCGTHLTVADNLLVSESTRAVQAPVVLVAAANEP